MGCAVGAIEQARLRGPKRRPLQLAPDLTTASADSTDSLPHHHPRRPSLPPPDRVSVLSGAGCEQGSKHEDCPCGADVLVKSKNFHYDFSMETPKYQRAEWLNVCAPWNRKNGSEVAMSTSCTQPAGSRMVTTFTAFSTGARTFQNTHCHLSLLGKVPPSQFLAPGFRASWQAPGLAIALLLGC